MRADLHLHSYCSDGKYSPAEVVRLAAAAGVQALSLTDHDGMEGCDEAEREAERLGLVFVPGWEISAYENDCKVHILGYGCERNEAYKSFLEARSVGERRRAEEMLSRGNGYFATSLTWEDIEALHTVKSTPVHTMLIVNAFAKELKRDPASVYIEAFVRGKSGYSNTGRPSTREAIEAIHEMGGKAVLAHPGRILLFGLEEEREYYKKTENRAMLKKRSDGRRDLLLQSLFTLGLDGIECHYTTHTADETEFFLSFANEHGLLVTGGSDFHAEGGRAQIGEPRFEADEQLIGLLSKGSR